MNKRVLIIANPGRKGAENYCEGVNKDVENYQRYFLSATGGNWYQDEIEVLMQPSRSLAEQKIQAMNSFDFSIIVFVGHGYSRYGDTYLELRPGRWTNDTENDISVEKLKNPKQKRIIIVDCCRKAWEPILEHAQQYSLIKASTSAIGYNTRREYEMLIHRMHVMNIVMYSCDLGETAGDDSRKGGYYSYSLLNVCYAAARECVHKGGFYYLSAVGAHDRAVPLVQAKKEDQNPQIEKPRSGEYLPLAVVVGSKG